VNGIGRNRRGDHNVGLGRMCFVATEVKKRLVIKRNSHVLQALFNCVGSQQNSEHPAGCAGNFLG